jgi:hypothetical protein
MKLLSTARVGAMITASASRNLQSDWGIVLDAHVLHDIGAGDPSRWKKMASKNWIDALLTATGDRFIPGGVVTAR